MLSFRTTGYNGYALQYSPFFDDKIAVALAANYGLVGNGRLFILEIGSDGNIVSPILWETQDGLFDMAWSEIHENQAVVASGDGLLKLFDTTVSNFPVRNWQEHTREVFSVNWNLVDKSTFISASWDGSIKIWLPERQGSLLTLNPSKRDHTTNASPLSHSARPPLSHQHQHQHQQNASTVDCIYSASFSPHLPSTIVSCNGGLRVQVWDIREKHALQIEYVAHGGLEALSCDWNKYKPHVIASAGTDKSVRVWDLRKVAHLDQPHPHAPLPAYHMRGPTPLNEFLGHSFAVRRVQWLPHNSQELQSVSYDMTARIWRDELNDKARFLKHDAPTRQRVFNKHREFVIGCDYSLWGEPGWTATTAWDEMVYVWDSKKV